MIQLNTGQLRDFLQNMNLEVVMHFFFFFLPLKIDPEVYGDIAVKDKATEIVLGIKTLLFTNS